MPVAVKGDSLYSPFPMKEHTKYVTKDPYLFYHPEIPTTTDTEVLYILNNKDQLERMSGISKHLASDLMRRIQLHEDMINKDIMNKNIDKMNGNSQQAQWN